MIKNRTKFALTVGIGLSVLSGVVHGTSLVVKPGLFAQSRLGPLGVLHNEDGFHVLEDDGNMSQVPRHLVSPVLQNVSPKDFEIFMGNGGRLHVEKGSDDIFSIKEGGGLKGGGPMTGAACYWTVKSLGYVGLGAFVVGAGIVGAITSRPSHSAPGAAHSVQHGTALSTLATAIIAKTGAIAAIEGVAAAAGAAGTASPLP